MTLPAFAAKLWRLLHAGTIDISCPPGAQQQTRRTPLLLSIVGTDRQTDARPFRRPCSSYYADSVNSTGRHTYFSVTQFRKATRKGAPSVTIFTDSVITDHVGGKDNAIGRVRLYTCFHSIF